VLRRPAVAAQYAERMPVQMDRVVPGRVVFHPEEVGTPKPLARLSATELCSLCSLDRPAAFRGASVAA
jgi:hypothetical protein